MPLNPWTHSQADTPTEQQIHHTTSIGEGVLQNHVIGNAPQKQQFTKLSIIAFAFVICNSWAGVAGSIQLALLQGGPATLIYGIMISSLAYFSIAASLSELASVYPTAGGQYHFASILAPRKAKQVVSYACGLLSIFSWIAIGAAVTIIPAQQIMALVSLYNTGFETKEWHVFLIYQGMALLILLYNMFALKWTSWTHYIGCKLSNRRAILASFFAR
jgi:choline transport protein